ncbi:uncharacterized protein LOC132201160 [Neocloeon triangulifer]|uniref:uncharacterized protein LOC132201160 n=1 Tax=Neocloeon triangulifer TaxID=2078957 RepID=UPI00286F08A2|nr:uncharacterized protein LOC132201160 [Neocloeon triangulifer]
MHFDWKKSFKLHEPFSGPNRNPLGGGVGEDGASGCPWSTFGQRPGRYKSSTDPPRHNCRNQRERFEDRKTNPIITLLKTSQCMTFNKNCQRPRRLSDSTH